MKENKVDLPKQQVSQQNEAMEVKRHMGEWMPLKRKLVKNKVKYKDRRQYTGCNTDRQKIRKYERDKFQKHNQYLMK